MRKGTKQLPLIGGIVVLTCVVRAPKDICQFSLVKDLLRQRRLGRLAGLWITWLPASPTHALGSANAFVVLHVGAMLLSPIGQTNMSYAQTGSTTTFDNCTHCICMKCCKASFKLENRHEHMFIPPFFPHVQQLWWMCCKGRTLYTAQGYL